MRISMVRLPAANTRIASSLVDPGLRRQRSGFGCLRVVTSGRVLHVPIASLHLKDAAADIDSDFFGLGRNRGGSGFATGPLNFNLRGRFRGAEHLNDAVLRPVPRSGVYLSCWTRPLSKLQTQLRPDPLRIAWRPFQAYPQPGLASHIVIQFGL